MTVVQTAMASRHPVAWENAAAHRQALACDIGVTHCQSMSSDSVASETSTTKAVTAAAETADMASATAEMASATAAPCERDRAGRRCRDAEYNGGCCCNNLLAHFSELLLFRRRWLGATRSLSASCCDWLAIAPIGRAAKSAGSCAPQRHWSARAARNGLDRPFMADRYSDRAVGRD
jgi:hypothetical protein